MFKANETFIKRINKFINYSIFIEQEAISAVRNNAKNHEQQ